MLYHLLVSLLFALLFGESFRTRAADSFASAGIVTAVGVFLSLTVPPFLFRYSNSDTAPVVLTRLIQRAIVGSAAILASVVLVMLVFGSLSDPTLVAELYLFTLLALFLFHVVGEVITRHVLYLQQTNQYNSNQLFAMLVGMTLLLFILILYFLAFDLARPPEFHTYIRDLLAITLTFVGFGRAVYLMAHH